MTRAARLSNSPRFSLAEHDGARVTLTADNGAVAHVFVLEDDIIRVLLLTGGAVTSAPSWAVAPGLEDLAEPGRDRLDVSGFTAPDFAVTETDALIIIATPRLSLEITRAGFFCRWSQAEAGGWRVIAEDRPTQAYNFAGGTRASTTTSAASPASATMAWANGQAPWIARAVACA